MLSYYRMGVLKNSCRPISVTSYGNVFPDITINKHRKLLIRKNRTLTFCNIFLYRIKCHDIYFRIL